MQKILLIKIAIINIAIFWVFTPNVYAGNLAVTEDNGIALIAQGNGEFTCGNGKQLTNVNLFVLLSEKTRQGLGTGPSGMGLKSAENNQSIAIKLNSGYIDSNNFHVEGILQVDNFCESEYSVSFTANGICGVDQTITIKGTDESLGTFQSNVSCSPLD